MSKDDDLKKFIEEHEEEVIAIARRNAVYNEDGDIVLTKDDEWRDEDEWDKHYEKLTRKNMGNDYEDKDLAHIDKLEQADPKD